MTTGEGDLPEFRVIWQEQSKSGWLRGPEPKKGRVVGEPCDEGKEVWGRREPRQALGGWAEGSHPLCDKKWGHEAMWGLNALPFTERSLLKITAPQENLFQALDYATSKGGPRGFVHPESTVCGREVSFCSLPLTYLGKWKIKSRAPRTQKEGKSWL